MGIFKRSCAGFLTSLMIVLILVSVISVEAVTNPYPESQTINGVTTIPCTWYAWQQAYDNLGVAMPNFGNAKNWYASAERNNYPVGSTAKPNSIAVWTNSGYGHVGYVVSVSGSTMKVSEGGMTDLNGNPYNGNGILNGSTCNSTVGSKKSNYSSSILVGFIYVGEKAHTHSYSLGTEAAHPHKVYMKCSCGDLYYTGETAAMNESVKSDYLKSAATCGSKAVYYKSCSVCGQASSDTFESGEFDYSNHVGSTYLKDQTNATCYKEGYTGDTCCSTCDRVVSKGHTIAKSAHNPASVWTTDEVSHWKECQTVDCGNIIDKAAHSGGEATCVSKAVCSVCRGEYGEVNADNHKHTEVRGEKTATCCEEGYTGDTWCTDCNTKLAAGTQTDKLAHSLTVVEAKAATVTEQGNIKYYLCEDCGKYFSDAEGENEISLADTVIQKLPPEIIDGKNMTVNQGEKKSLSFRSNAAFADFVRVELDGKTLDESNYTKAEDGIAVTLNADFVATISAGKHTLSIVSESGSADAEFTVKAGGSAMESPKTGEGSGVVAWSFAAVISLAALGFALTLRKKRAR